MFFLNFCLAFETELLLRPNIGASANALDAPSHTSMVVEGQTENIIWKSIKLGYLQGLKVIQWMWKAIRESGGHPEGHACWQEGQRGQPERVLHMASREKIKETE